MYLNGLEVPADFPLDIYDAATEDAEHIVRSKGGSLTADWIGGWMGLAYRFLAAAEHDLAFVRLLEHGSAPPQPYRYQQDRELTAFIVMAHSSLECLFYSAHAIASAVDPGAAPMTTPEQKSRVNRKACQKAWCRILEDGAFYPLLLKLEHDPEWTSPASQRHTVIHRSQPGRDLAIGRPNRWFGKVLDDTFTAKPRAWIAGALRDLIAALHANIVVVAS
jgi:hypothetical protein